MNTASILGVQFHAVTKQQAVELAMSKIRSRQKGYVVTPNPEIVDLCRHDEKFMGVVNHATLVLPDGIGRNRCSNQSVYRVDERMGKTFHSVL